MHACSDTKNEEGSDLHQSTTCVASVVQAIGISAAAIVSLSDVVSFVERDA